jgi:hypothetical protein
MTVLRLDVLTDRVADKGLPTQVPANLREARTLAAHTAYLLSQALPFSREEEVVLAALRAALPGTLDAAFGGDDAIALLDVHETLYVIYEVSFANPLAPAAVHEHSSWLTALRQSLEEAWLAYELPRIEPELPDEADLRCPDHIGAWFQAQAQRESPLDRQVVRFLAEDATRADFITFILADGPLNYRFFDALVLAQLHYSEVVKEEISHHLWDECGGGCGERAHTRQFTRAVQALGLSQPRTPIWKDWRPYAGHNLYFCFGLNRRHYFKALGSLAMPELFDPGRDRAVVAGIERLRLGDHNELEYYYSHIEGDEEHGPSWLNHVIQPIVEAQPEAGRELALGGALRMEAMRRYNAYLARQFGLTDDRGNPTRRDPVRANC